MNAVISPDDDMIPPDHGVNGYRFVGLSAVECIRAALAAAGGASRFLNHDRRTRPVQNILDLPCGHGRVLRWLRAAYPTAEITACDLKTDGVDFCAKEFGAKPLYSHPDPAQIPLASSAYDLIWVGSLLTHFDHGYWDRFLDLFERCLRPGGVVVFTAHGRQIVSQVASGDGSAFGITPYRDRLLQTYGTSGFSYCQYPTMPGDYGFSLSSPEWVFRRMAGRTDLRLVHFSEQAWANYHDVFAYMKAPGWLPKPREAVPPAAAR